MAACLFCLTTGDGNVVFSRNSGSFEQIPYPVIGSVNGVHMYLRSNNCVLNDAVSNGSKVFWKVYHDSITLILVLNASCGWIDELHVDLFFHAIVMHHGLDDIRKIVNFEKFRSDIRSVFHFIDHLLATMVQVHSLVMHTLCSDVMIATESSKMLQVHLDGFVSAAQSNYGCCLVRNQVAAATEKWWSLSETETILLPLFVASLPDCSAMDVAVFLPHTSPQTPHRLLVFTIMPGIKVCVICGSSPSLIELERKIDVFWKIPLDSSLNSLYCHSLSSEVSSVSSVIVCWLLVNRLTATYRYSACDNSLEGAHVVDTLPTMGTFYRDLCDVLSSEPISATPNVDSDAPRSNGAYACYQNHKGFALQRAEHQLFVIFKSSVMTYAMRSLTEKVFDVVTRNR